MNGKGHKGAFGGIGNVLDPDWAEGYAGADVPATDTLHRNCYIMRRFRYKPPAANIRVCV